MLSPPKSTEQVAYLLVDAKSALISEVKNEVESEHKSSFKRVAGSEVKREGQSEVKCGLKHEFNRPSMELGSEVKSDFNRPSMKLESEVESDVHLFPKSCPNDIFRWRQLRDGVPEHQLDTVGN